MTLENYISEAVSHGKYKSPGPMYTPFPKKRTDKDAIINWLLENGFVNCGGYPSTETLLKYYRDWGKKCFQLAAYITDNPTSEWLMFYDGKDAFIIRTCKASEVHSGSALCSIYRDLKEGMSYHGRRIDFNDIKKHFDEQ